MTDHCQTKGKATAPSCGQTRTFRTVTQQEVEGGQTGSFMREEARDSQPAPASLLSYYSPFQARKPEQGAVLGFVGCPVMKVKNKLKYIVSIQTQYPNNKNKTLTVHRKLTVASSSFLILLLIVADFSCR